MHDQVDLLMTWFTCVVYECLYTFCIGVYVRMYRPGNQGMCMDVLVCVCACVCVYVHVCVRARACMHVCVHVLCTSVCVCPCVHVLCCMTVCIHVLRR